MVRKSLSWGVALLLVLSAVPSPNTSAFYHEMFSSHFRYLPSSYLSDDYYLNRFSPDYREVKILSSLLRNRHIHGRVYTLGPRVQYNFAQNGYQAIGDWMGPAGYFRLFRAIDVGRAVDFMHTYKVQAVLVSPAKVIGGLDVPLARQLTSGGYCEVSMPHSMDRAFVYTSQPCSTDVEKGAHT